MERTEARDIAHSLLTSGPGVLLCRFSLRSPMKCLGLVSSKSTRCSRRTARRRSVKFAVLCLQGPFKYNSLFAQLFVHNIFAPERSEGARLLLEALPNSTTFLSPTENKSWSTTVLSSTENKSRKSLGTNRGVRLV